MQSRDYLQDSFDLKLFFLNCIKRIWVVLLSMVLGGILIGGIYYVKNVTLAGQVPYQITNKYYLTYEVDPSDQLTYSYFAGYTWTDFLQADACVERMKSFLQEKGIQEKDDEKIRAAYQAKLESDLRVLYVTVTDTDQNLVSALSEALTREMLLFPSEHREIAETSLMTTGVVALAKTDIRTFRACVLGTVLGGFFAVFGLGLWMIIFERLDTPIQLRSRFHYPVLGYMDRQGEISGNCSDNVKEILGSSEKIALVTADEKLPLEAFAKKMEDIFSKELSLQSESGDAQDTEKKTPAWSYIQDAIHAEGKYEALKGQDEVIVAVKAGCSNVAAVKQLLLDLEQNEIQVSALVLLEADARLIRYHMFGKRK